MEETGILRDLLQASDWMCPIDLKDVAIPFSNHLSGTSTVPLFHLEGDHVQVHLLSLWSLQFLKVFTKLMKPVMTFLWGQDLKTIIYLDDLLIMSQ